MAKPGHMSSHVYPHVYPRVYTHAYLHACAHAYTHVYTHAYTHVYTQVMANWQGEGELYPGQVIDVEDDGTYTVLYDDNDVEREVPWGHTLRP